MAVAAARGPVVLEGLLGSLVPSVSAVLSLLIAGALLLPSLALCFRRLHDTDRSAWWALLFLIPFIGWLIIIVFNCQAGTPGENRFGPDPKLEQE